MRLSVEQRRTALAHAALTVIARDGLAAATTRAIVAEAGMALASFHYAYESRVELLRDVIRLVLEGERDAVGALLDLPEADFATLIRGGLGAYVGNLREAPGREQGMLELTFHSLREPALEGMALEQYAHYRALVTGLLLAAAERCGMRWLQPVEQLARFVVTCTDGLTVAWLVDHDDAAIEPQLDLIAAALLTQAQPIGEHP